MDATNEKKDDVQVVTPIQSDKIGVQSTVEVKKEIVESKDDLEKAEKEKLEKEKLEAEKLKKESDDINEVEKLKKEKDKDDNIDNEDKVEINGIVYILDKEGNAILDGKIVYSKTDIDSMLPDDDQTDKNVATIEHISSVSGIIPIDESGKPIEYDMSVEGLAKREHDIYNIGKSKGFEEGFENFLKSNPDVADIINYKNNFGTIEGYTNYIDYTKAELPTKEDELYQLIIKAEIQKGTSPERAKRLADFAKNNNSLKEDAEESFDYLKKSQNDKIKHLKEKQDLMAREAREADVKFYGIDYDEKGKEIVANVSGSIYDSIIVKGEVKGYSIPLEGINIRTQKGVQKLTRRELFDYISKPIFQDDQGIVYTQAQLDEIAIGNSVEDYVLRCISNLEGGIESLIKRTLGDKQVLHIKKLSSNKDKSKRDGTKIDKNDDGKKPSIILPVNKQN